MEKLFAVMHYDYESPDWSKVTFLGLSKDECYAFIDENFQDYLEYEWNEEDDGVFIAKEIGENWLKTELNLEVVAVNSMSESLAEIVHVYNIDEDARKKNEGKI